MRRIIPYLVFLTFLGCAPRFIYYTSPLPGVTSVLETPEFWIEKLPHPDSVLLSGRGVRALNRKTAEGEAYFDVLEKDTIIYGSELKDAFYKQLRRNKTKNRVSHTGLPLSQSFWREIKERMDLGNIADTISPLCGITLKGVHLRTLPTNEVAVSSRSCEFDKFQVTSVRPFEPVLILHRSHDKDWLYVKCSIAEGWVAAEDIAGGMRDTVASFLDTPFVVVTAPEIALYGDRDLEEFLMWLPMGTRVKLVKIHPGEAISVIMPIRGVDGKLGFQEAFLLNNADVHLGYLPYTQRNMINQAFRLLSFPYGRGGTWDADDCSGTILRIFSCFGINLPRNSREQLRVGIKLASFGKNTTTKERTKALYRAVPGITILGWPGHIMFYLGEYAGRHYCLQNIWAVRKRRWFSEDVLYIGKTVVSDLSLGSGSRRGSLLERLTTARMVMPANLVTPN